MIQCNMKVDFFFSVEEFKICLNMFCAYEIVQVVQQHWCVMAAVSFLVILLANAKGTFCLAEE